MAELARTALVMVGSAYGGPLGAIAGSLVGGLLFPEKLPNIEGPRLKDRRVTSSTLGSPVNNVYGTYRVNGNIIWSGGIIETAHERSVGGKGGPTQVETSYTYDASFAVSLCEGPITGVRRIWVDGKLIYKNVDSNSESEIMASYNLNVDVYLGGETQVPSSSIQTDRGIAEVSAHRGLCYIVFNHFQLEVYGNRIPNITAEVVNDGDTVGFRRTQVVDPLPHRYAAHSSWGGAGVGRPIIRNFTGNRLQVGILNSDTVYQYSIDGDYVGISTLSSENLPEYPAFLLFDYYPVGIMNGHTLHRKHTGDATNKPNTQMPINHLATVDKADVADVLPNGIYIINCFLSQDGLRVLVVTSPQAAPSFTDSWYMVKLQGFTPVLVDQGTISPGQFATYSYGHSATNIFGCGIMENDYIHIWTVYGAGDGNVQLSVIENGDLSSVYDFNSGNGLASWSFTYPSVYAVNGMMWAISKDTMVIFNRHSALNSVNTVTLASVITAICAAAGLAAADIDVSGLTETVTGYIKDGPMTGRAALEPLLDGYNVVGFEQDWKIVFMTRAASVEAIDEGDFVQPKVKLIRQGDNKLPRRVTAQYADAARDYIIATQMAQRVN